MCERDLERAGDLWRLRVGYDGRPFLGWQRQDQGPTVQEALDTALAVLLRHPVACTGAPTRASTHAARWRISSRVPSRIRRGWSRD